jgi:hypothetical protein
MDVFISWSGERSRRAAEALRTWLPKVINAVKPWLSSTDIEKGSRWGTDVAVRLGTAKLGIICLTPGNLHADWILFEAGALSKTLQNTYVCPLLFELQPAEVKGPLAQFQLTRGNRDEVRQLLKTINSALGDLSLPEVHLNEAFDVWWPKLEEQFLNLPAEDEHPSPARPEREILEEILGLVRTQVRASTVTGTVGSAAALDRSPLKGELKAIDDTKRTGVYGLSVVKAELPDDLGLERESEKESE